MDAVEEFELCTHSVVARMSTAKYVHPHARRRLAEAQKATAKATTDAKSETKAAVTECKRCGELATQLREANAEIQRLRTQLASKTVDADDDEQLRRLRRMARQQFDDEVSALHDSGTWGLYGTRVTDKYRGILPDEDLA
jgi:hypothetical protein